MAKQKTVKIDLDIYEYIQEKCIPLEEDVSKALRRLLSIHPSKPRPNPPPNPTPSRQTPVEAYLIPALEALSDLGGQAVYAEVKKRVFQQMKEQLNPIDLTPVPSGGQLRWEKRLGWAGYQLRKDEMKTSPSRGVWQITDKGRKYLRNERIQNARNGSTRKG